MLNTTQPKPIAGNFVETSYTDGAGTRFYKTYVPTAYRGQWLPLVVMLHGCTQNPDDFAAGTRMNEAAEQNQCFVVYPAQTPEANRSLCWNWFNALDQDRDQGEPSLIAGITREVMATYHIDTERVFVAGMSAGGAMALIVATVYPEIYKSLGVHSGMPYKSAQNLFAALAAMRYGTGKTPRIRPQTIPLIVFHGDKDRRVHPHNGEQIVSQGLAARPAGSTADSKTELLKRANGRSYTRAIFRDVDLKTVAEHWIVNGAGHAWSGGDARGSHTDTLGPDASREMLRFFLGGPDLVEDGQTGRFPRRFVRKCLKALKIAKGTES